jgi:serine/threonine-protein kinase HipA
MKPNTLSAHYPNSAVNEWFCARLAQELRLPVPPVELRYVPSSIYIIKRFDRRLREGNVERLHTLDAVQLLSLSAGAKYAKSGVEALVDIVDLCRAKAATRIALFRWSVFNLLIGNGDAHLKNLSLFAGPDGYELAPHYDLVSTAAWSSPELTGSGEPVWPDVPLTFGIGKARTFSEITPHEISSFAESLNIPPTFVNRTLSQMTGQITKAAEKIHQEFEVRKDVPPTVRAGEVRMLLSIRHLPIATMAGKLSTA